MDNLGELDGLREANNGDLNSTSQEVYRRILRPRERSWRPHRTPGDGQPRLYLVLHCPCCCRHNDDKKWSQINWILSRPSVPDEL